MLSGAGNALRAGATLGAAATGHVLPSGAAGGGHTLFVASETGTGRPGGSELVDIGIAAGAGNGAVRIGSGAGAGTGRAAAGATA